MDLSTVTADLYALAPGDFTAARNERAKAARDSGDKELAEQIRRLPKPSTAAWVVNMLVQHHAAEVDRVLDLGASLREAQQDLDAQELRELNRQRHGLVAAVTRQGRTLAKDLGHRVSESIAVEVEQTLRAAMADADAAAAVRSGRLTKSLSSTGLGSADLSGAVGPRTQPPAQPPSQRRAEARTRPRPDRAAEARKAAQDAEAAAAAAEAGLRQAQGAVDDAAARAEQLVAELGKLRRQVRQLEEEAGAAEQRTRAAERSRDAARRTAESRRRAAERARERVQRLG